MKCLCINKSNGCCFIYEVECNEVLLFVVY